MTRSRARGVLVSSLLVVAWQVGNRFVQRPHHWRDFYALLVDVATFALGRPERYNWQREYSTIRRWAIQQGLTGLPVCPRAR